MHIASFVLLTAFIFASSASVVAQDDRELTMDQIALVQSIEGEWQVEKIIVAGREFREKVPFVGANVTEAGFTFLQSPEKSTNITANFSEIDAEAKRINLVLTINEKRQRHVIRIESDDIWLVTRTTDNSALPDSLRPSADNVCILLTRKQEDSEGDRN